MSGEKSEQVPSQGITGIAPPAQLLNYLTQQKRPMLVPPTPPQLHPTIGNINPSPVTEPKLDNSEQAAVISSHESTPPAISLHQPSLPAISAHGPTPPSGVHSTSSQVKMADDVIEQHQAGGERPTMGPGASEHALPTPPPQQNLASSEHISQSLPISISDESLVNEDPTTDTDTVDERTGMLSWLQHTVKKSEFLSKIADKAMSSMDSVLTTLDPGMKGFLERKYAMRAVADCQPLVRQALVNGFSQIFEEVNVLEISSETTLPPQIVGHDFAWNAVKERLANLRTKTSTQKGWALLAVQPFIQRIGDIWLDTALVVYEDLDQQYSVLVQGVQIDPVIIETLTKRTPKSYTANAFATTVGYAYAEHFGCSPHDWQHSVLSLSSSEIYRLAAVALGSKIIGKNALSKPV